MPRYPFKILAGPVPPVRLGRKSTALLLLDPQEFISLPEAGVGLQAMERGISAELDEYYRQTEAAIGNMARLLCECRKRDITVIYSVLNSQGAHQDDLSRQLQVTGLPVPIGDPRADIRREVTPLSDEWVLRRGAYSPFIRTDLAARLQDAHLNVLLMAGMMANVSLALAAREAADRGFGVVVVWDASASETLDQHVWMKESIVGGLIRVRSTCEVVRLMGDACP